MSKPTSNPNPQAGPKANKFSPEVRERAVRMV